MRKLGLRGVRRGGWKKPRTTVPDPSQRRPADLVNRDFAPPAPDRLWVVDFTFVATRAGTAYTALVIDAFARLIPGWRTAASHSTDLVLDALVMAVTYRARQGVKVAGLVHHSDAGAEYLSIRYGAELAAAGIAPSVGSVGDSYDNALAESIVGLYKTEVIDHLGPWETPAQVEAATSEWASWYNTARVMRRTGGRPPAEYEQAWRDGMLGQVPARGLGSRPRRPPEGTEGGGHGRRSLSRRAPPELLDRTLIWNQGHLRRILRQYETHHNQHRPHRPLDAAAPLKPLPQPVILEQHRVRRQTRAGGTINEYRLVA